MARTGVVDEQVDEHADEPASEDAESAPRRTPASFFSGDLLDELKARRPESPVGWVRLGSGIAAVLLVVVSFFIATINPVQWLVIAIQRGAIFSLIALGIALVYKATRVLNFAQGELGTVPAFVAYAIMVGFDWSDTGPAPDGSRLWWASIAAIAFGVGLAILVNVLVVQRLATASAVTALVATAGVFLLLLSAQVIVFEAKVRPFPAYIEGTAFELAGVNVDWQTLVILGVLAIAATLIAIFFRTPPGVALLATAQEPFAAELSGISVRMMSTLAWAAAGILGAVGGLLGAGAFTNIRPGAITTQFLIPAFVAAVLGGLTSMVGAVVGGIVLGMATVYANELVLGMGWGIPGPPQVATLVILLLVLLLRPRGLFGKEA